MAFLAELPQLLANGLIAGSITALVAIGYTMVFGVLKFINFAHGEIFMAGAYLSYLFAAVLGWHPVLAVITSMLCSALLGIAIERIAYRPLRYQSRLNLIITALGVSLLLQSIAMLAFGTDIKSFGYHFAPYNILGAAVTPLQIVIAVAAVIVLLALYSFLTFTTMGKAIRAAADNFAVAQIIGINLDRVIMVMFAIGSAMAALAGSLISMEQNLQPTMGVMVGIYAFTAAVVGGIGNIWGAALGGFLIGLIENFGVWFLPSGYKGAITFAVLILVLFLRPQGLFGESEETQVRA